MSTLPRTKHSQSHKDPLSAWWLPVGLDQSLEFWVRFPNERNQGKQAHPVLKYQVPHGSQGSDPLCDWWLGLAPATLEFWVRFPNERNQGKQVHPVLKYRVPQGSQRVMDRLIHTGLGSSSLIAHVLHSPPLPREQLCNRSCSNKTHRFHA